MAEHLRRNWWGWGLAAVAAAQLFVYSQRITEGFYDGRMHLSWGPPFWLLKAEQMHKVDFWTAGRAGVVSEAVATPSGARPKAWYFSHPQFIAIPLYVWTGIFGTAEWSARSLAAFATLLSTVFLWLAVRERQGPRRATLFTALWAALPVIVVFGRKLDQEPWVMLFVSIAAFGHERFTSGRQKLPWCWSAAVAGMMWADWSGFVFAALFFAAQALLARHHRPTRRLLCATALGGAAGLAIVGAQTILTGGTLSAMQAQYYGRSGRAGDAAWSYWLGRQRDFWRVNFTFIPGLLGLLWALGARLRGLSARRLRELQGGGMSLGWLFFLVALGTLAYAGVVRQAAAVHLYYQYFYSLFVAWGLLELIEWCRETALRFRWPQAAATALWAACVGVLFYNGIAVFNMIESQSWGGPAEVKLLKMIKAFPPQATVAAIASPDFDNWLGHPNIQYYSGHKISAMLPGEGVRSDLVLLAPGDLDEKEAALDYLAGPKSKFRLRACTSALCLWERTPR